MACYFLLHYNKHSGGWEAIYLKLLPTVILTGKQHLISLKFENAFTIKLFVVLLFQKNHATITAVSGNS